MANLTDGQQHTVVREKNHQKRILKMGNETDSQYFMIAEERSQEQLFIIMTADEHDCI